MAEDLNTYDSAHVAVAPERMSTNELAESYRKAWRQFYSTAHMVNVLTVWRHDWSSYWNRLFFFAAYLYASTIEGLHPMNCGFWTVRDRHDRRPGLPREAFMPFCGEARAASAKLRGIVKLFFSSRSLDAEPAEKQDPRTLSRANREDQAGDQ